MGLILIRIPLRELHAMSRIILLFMCASLLLGACRASGPSPLPITATSPAIQIAPTNTTAPPTARPTVTPVPPTATQSAPTHTPGPKSLNPAGPYLLFGKRDGLWLANPDGSYVTKLGDFGQLNYIDLHTLVSPHGDRLALSVSGPEGLDLLEVLLPSGETHTLAHLLSINDNERYYEPVVSKVLTEYALSNFDSFAWQPGSGRLLAFMSAQNGPTADLYTYDTQTGAIRQLTNGPSQAIDPVWSPDGQYILHAGVSWSGPIVIGAVPIYPQINGIWAVRTSDGEVINQPVPHTLSFSVMGWQDNTHYLTDEVNGTCGSNLHSVDLLTGQTTPIMDFDYSAMAFSLADGALLFSTPASFSGATECNHTPGSGIYLLRPGETMPTQVSSTSPLELDWVPESQVFESYSVDAFPPVTLIAADGKTKYDIPRGGTATSPSISKLGYQAWVVRDSSDSTSQRVVVKLSTGDWQNIMSSTGVRIAQVLWDPLVGDALLILDENGRLSTASYPDFQPHYTGQVSPGVHAIWVP
jgi:WD40 repeat protein